MLRTQNLFGHAAVKLSKCDLDRQGSQSLADVTADLPALLLPPPDDTVTPEEDVIHAQEGGGVDHREVIGQAQGFGAELPDDSECGQRVESELGCQQRSI